MKDFHEAVLGLVVPGSMGNVYKKAIEADNSPYLNNWSGNHVHVDIGKDGEGMEEDLLIITLLSHTLPNLEKIVSWYESMGCEVISTNYKGGTNNGQS